MSKIATAAIALVLSLIIQLIASAQNNSRIAEAKFQDAQGKDKGIALITEVPGGVKITLDLTGLPPGTHGIHFHETGKCEAPSFESAGGHFNPMAREHGLDNPDGPHGGDLPNITITREGTLTTELISKEVTLKRGIKSLLKPGGTALVIHESADDLKSDPSGNSGARIACAVVKPRPVLPKPR